jgi:hypothetical protein
VIERNYPDPCAPIEMTFSTAFSGKDRFLKWMIIATNMSNAMSDELGQHDASWILRLVEERLKTKGPKP